MGLRTTITKKYLETDVRLHLDRMSGSESSELMYELLQGDAPCMIARFGSVELDTIIRYLSIKNRSKFGFSFFWNYMGWNTKRKTLLKNNAGFFSNSIPNINKFCELMISCMPNLDILMSWVGGENIVEKFFGNAKIAPLEALEPYYYAPPWTRALAGKKVLVIHPYAATIQEQYKKRELLFEDKDILPAFELKIIKAVQSIANEHVEYKDWFEALDHMKKQIAETDFDIAIIGCGAYGFPLASYVKDLGKKAVHMGGVTQIMFGIKGKRWDDIAIVSSMYNEYWTRPNVAETPTNASNVEGGCYW